MFTLNPDERLLYVALPWLALAFAGMFLSYIHEKFVTEGSSVSFVINFVSTKIIFIPLYILTIGMAYYFILPIVACGFNYCWMGW